MFVILPFNSRVFEQFYPMRCYIWIFIFSLLKQRTCTTISHVPQKAITPEAGTGTCSSDQCKELPLTFTRQKPVLKCWYLPRVVSRKTSALSVKGNELTITYTPPEGFPRPDWVMREYSRGGFVRTFTLDDSIDTTKISAKYEDGVLQVTLPIIAG